MAIFVDCLEILTYLLVLYVLSSTAQARVGASDESSNLEQENWVG